MAPRCFVQGVRPVSWMVKNWFLIGLVSCIVLAKLFPDFGKKGGALNPELTVKVLAVSFIFFTSGLTLPTEDLLQSVKQYKIHMFVQGFQFIFYPVAGFTIVKLLGAVTSVPGAILQGFLVVSCLPPPVSSAAILTRASGGNEAAAIFNSAFGSFLGIFVTPPLLMLLVGVESDVPALKIIKSLLMTVVVPLAAGQGVRMAAWVRIRPLNIPFGKMASTVLLLIIYSAFCDTFAGHDVAIGRETVVPIIAIVVSMILTFSVLTFNVAKFLGYARKDVASIMFCSTHKSLTLGMPILKIVFADHPMLSLLSLPLLAYHPIQIFLGGLLVPTMATWIDKRPASSADGALPFTSPPRRRSTVWEQASQGASPALVAELSNEPPPSAI